MNFAQSIKLWADNANHSIEKIRRAVVFSLFKSVILDTPVLEGRLRGDWQVTLNSPAKGEAEIIDPDGIKTIKNVTKFIQKMPKGEQDIYLTNNLPYAYKIEYGGHSSRKAPEGMVRKNIVRITENIRRKYG